MKIYADQEMHDALLQKERDRKKVTCEMKKITQNDVKMAMRRDKGAIKKRVQRQKAKSEKIEKIHIVYWSVDNAVGKGIKVYRSLYRHNAQLDAPRKVTSSPIESSNQSSLKRKWKLAALCNNVPLYVA